MKRNEVLIAVATTSVVVLMAAGSVFAAPKLLIDPAEFDFGYVPQNSTISHVFWLHSVGDDTLKILSVSPG